MTAQATDPIIQIIDCDEQNIRPLRFRTANDMLRRHHGSQEDSKRHCKRSRKANHLRSIREGFTNSVVPNQ